MVTILEPREVISVGHLPVIGPAPPRAARRYELSYSVPCAGVRYYSFRLAEKPRPAPMFLPVKLIDEKVILI